MPRSARPWVETSRLTSRPVVMKRRCGLSGVGVHQPEPQRLVGRQVDAPTRLTGGATALDRWIVSLQAVLPLHVVDVQAQRTGQGRLDEDVRILWPEAGDVGESADQPTIATPAGDDNPRAATTPRPGGRSGRRAQRER